jgi:hypothetical protein
MESDEEESAENVLEHGETAEGAATEPERVGVN